MKELLLIYLSFFKISGVTFGGGYAMLPILKREVVEKYNWTSEDQVVDYYAMSQCLPGIIAVNVAIFIGTQRKGPLGGIAAALGIVSPCIVIISILAMFLSMFIENIWVQHALAAISICVAALLSQALFGIFKKGVKNWFGLGLFLATLILTVATDLSPIVFVVAGGILGLLFAPRKEGKA